MATQAWHDPETRTPSIADDPREYPRAVSVGRASVRPLGQRESTDAALLDLSVYGCRLATDESHGDGDRVWLRFNRGWPVAATVVWVGDGRMGCRFDEPIPSSTMRDLTRTLI